MATEQPRLSALTGVLDIDYAEHHSVKIHDADYVYLEAGSGELIVLLHGFPDNAYSWEAQIRFFSSQGYRVVAPFLRAYAPTQTPDAAYFDRATVARDIIGLIEKLNGAEKAYLVGQDWGAAVSYGILGAYPDSIKRSVIMAVPHPVEIKRTLKRSPRHVIRSFHWFLFQLPLLPELMFKLSRGRFLRWLWKLWSPAFNDHEHVEHIIQTMMQGHGIRDSLAYYRAALQRKYRDPALEAVYARLDSIIDVPTRVLCGAKDMRAEMLARQGDLFSKEAQYEWCLVSNSGHFLHREQPAAVNELVLDWFQNSYTNDKHK